MQPLSAYLKQPRRPPPRRSISRDQQGTRKKNFFEYLDFALQFAPAAPNEADIRAKLATIGIGPGKTFDFKDLRWSRSWRFLLGLKEGEHKVDEAVARRVRTSTDGTSAACRGDRPFTMATGCMRAVVAKAGIYGNDAVEAMYPIHPQGRDRRPLDGSKHNYTLTFPAGQLPPVNAFWSVTMYDGKTQLLIENPINRYLINSPMLPEMKTNDDGSLTIYIQNESPGADKK